MSGVLWLGGLTCPGGSANKFSPVSSPRGRHPCWTPPLSSHTAGHCPERATTGGTVTLKAQVTVPSHLPGGLSQERLYRGSCISGSCQTRMSLYGGPEPARGTGSQTPGQQHTGQTPPCPPSVKSEDGLRHPYLPGSSSGLPPDSTQGSDGRGQPFPTADSQEGGFLRLPSGVVWTGGGTDLTAPPLQDLGRAGRQSTAGPWGPRPLLAACLLSSQASSPPRPSPPLSTAFLP